MWRVRCHELWRLDPELVPDGEQSINPIAQGAALLMQLSTRVPGIITQSLAMTLSLITQSGPIHERSPMTVFASMMQRSEMCTCAPIHAGASTCAVTGIWQPGPHQIPGETCLPAIKQSGRWPLRSALVDSAMWVAVVVSKTVLMASSRRRIPGIGITCVASGSRFVKINLASRG